MDLSLQRPGDHLFIRAVSERGIQVADTWYTDSLLISAQQVVANWGPASTDQLDDSSLEAIFQLQPEIVLLGTGQQQHFLPPAQLMEFYNRGIGIEVMSTGAACRTFNILVGEGRQVLAALFQSMNGSSA